MNRLVVVLAGAVLLSGATETHRSSTYAQSGRKPDGGPAADAEVAMALTDEVSVDFVEMPFDEVLAYLSALRHIRIDADWKALEAVGVSRQTPVTFESDHIKLKALLTTVLYKVTRGPNWGAVKYQTKNGGIWITAKTRKSKPKLRMAEISYPMDYNGDWVRGVSTFVFSVTIQEIDEKKGKALVRLNNIRRNWTSIAHGGTSGPRESNIRSMPFTDPRGYYEYGAPAAWGRSVSVGDTAWISLAELKNKRGQAGDVTDTGKLARQLDNLGKGVEATAKAAEGLGKIKRAFPDPPSNTSTNNRPPSPIAAPREDCRFCNGTGRDKTKDKIDCTSCDGTGKVRCHYRRRERTYFTYTGRAFEDWECAGGELRTELSGYVRDDKVTSRTEHTSGKVCPNCNGKGETNCSTCKGKGETYPKCAHCNGSGKK